MTLLQAYIFREWFWTLLAVTAVLLIVLMGVFLGELLNDMADGRVPAGLLGIQLLLNLPDALSKILPLAGFVAVMWGLGRMYRDHEMVVMRSSGFSWLMLLRPLALLVLPVAVLLLVLTFVVAPRAAQKSDAALEEALRSAALWGLQDGRFHIMQGGDFVIYVERLDTEGRTLENVFVRQQDGLRTKIWQAATGEYWVDTTTGNRFLKLTDGQITDALPNARDLRVLQFERNDIMLPEPAMRTDEERLEARGFTELVTQGGAEASAELQWRLSPALAVIVLGLLAIPLAHSDPREGRSSRVVLGILAYALYANTLYLCRAWVAGGELPPALGLWWVHALVFISALWWLRRQGRMVGRS
ncbi:LPS export ABC transporter permease LptF [Marinihelvus fidelis]|uniref:Lipopolysaccharide export system permease protein LptF n=1 Tax=Marinihelvus fidelis TaxID=2613842 RepID=A0A5N0T7S7_9GAMM|nr:LPS export ABC transporter permease LptF [Marinihelvus fidelis]KAA9130788.1 LPS export ABC transporter permease LptF [Marinihelvus fidelis]